MGTSIKVELWEFLKQKMDQVSKDNYLKPEDLSCSADLEKIRERKLEDMTKSKEINQQSCKKLYAIIKSDNPKKGEILRKVKYLMKDLQTSDSDEASASEQLEGETKEQMLRRIKRRAGKKQKIKMIKKMIVD